METLAIIPCRKGSKGLPGKNTKDFCGKPLVLWTIEEIKKCKSVTRVLLSTDDPKAREVALANGVEVPFMRPKRLAGDYVPMHPVIEYTVKKLLSMGYEFDIFVLRDCTVPFIQNKDIQGAVDLLKKKSFGTSGTKRKVIRNKQKHVRKKISPSV